MLVKNAITRSLLAALCGTLAACGPQTTVLTATGPFSSRDVRDFDRHNNSDGSRLLSMTLSGTDKASMKLTVRPASATCWKSIDSEHACTERKEPGTLDEGLLEVSGITCALNGWVEDLGGAWQLDLTVEPSALCDEGRFAITIEP